MQCVRCQYNGGGGYFSAPDGDVCETCAAVDPKMQFGAIVNLLFQVPYIHLRPEYKEAVDQTIEKFHLSMDEIQAEVDRLNEECAKHFREEAERITKLEDQGIYNYVDEPFKIPTIHVIND